MTDQELKDLVASLAVSQAATSKAQDRNDTLFAANAVQFAATDAQLAATEALVAANAVQFAANAMQFAATASQVVETSRKLDAMGIRLGNMGQNQDAVAEEFFYNSLQAKPTLGGVHDDDVFHSVRSFSGKLQGEYDVVMVNGQSVALIEVKCVVHPQDIDKTIIGTANYRTLFPQHKVYAIYGAIAGFKIAPHVAELAKERELMVLKRAGDSMEVDAGTPHRF